MQIINLFDQDTVTRLFTARYRDPIPVTDEQFFGGHQFGGDRETR